MYGRGTHDRKLKREPLKDSTRPGEKRTYDSVQVCTRVVCVLYVGHLRAFKCVISSPPTYALQGNISGHNEFVVYNAYRVLPEYVIEYSRDDAHHDARERRRAMLHNVVQQLNRSTP